MGIFCSSYPAMMGLNHRKCKTPPSSWEMETPVSFDCCSKPAKHRSGQLILVQPSSSLFYNDPLSQPEFAQPLSMDFTLFYHLGAELLLRNALEMVF